MLPITGTLLFLGPLLAPSFAKHNDPQIAARVRDMLGPNVPIEETWYSQGKVFTGRGAEYLRLRFPKESRATVQTILRDKCTARDGYTFPFNFTPEAFFMKWDPVEQPIEPYTCGGYAVDFGASGDSLLFFEPGH